jgi:hypothetical protein
MRADRGDLALLYQTFAECAEAAAKILDHYQLTYGAMQMAFHGESDQLFVLVLGPRRVILGLIPIDDETEAWFQEQFPGAEVGPVDGLQEWAAWQPWTPVASIGMVLEPKEMRQWQRN